MSSIALNDDFFDEVEKLEDQSVVDNSGGGDYVPPAAGVTLARLVEYVELGKQPQRPYQGKAKPPADEVRMVFDLLGPKWVHDVEHEDGTKSKRADRFVLTLNKSLNKKARFKKVFSAMTYGRPIKHLARCLNEVFILEVKHNTVGEGADKKVYANIIDATGIHIRSPIITDVTTGETKDVRPSCPAALSDLRMFIWDVPKLNHWTSLFIDGEYTVKDDKGVETSKSKNTIQQKILKAVNYQGSPLQILLGKLNSLPDTKSPQGAETDQGLADDNQATQTTAGAKPQPAGGAASAADDLSALGLSFA